MPSMSGSPRSSSTISARGAASAAAPVPTRCTAMPYRASPAASGSAIESSSSTSSTFIAPPASGGEWYGRGA